MSAMKCRAAGKTGPSQGSIGCGGVMLACALAGVSCRGGQIVVQQPDNDLWACTCECEYCADPLATSFEPCPPGGPTNPEDPNFCKQCAAQFVTIEGDLATQVCTPPNESDASNVQDICRSHCLGKADPAVLSRCGLDRTGTGQGAGDEVAPILVAVQTCPPSDSSEIISEDPNATVVHLDSDSELEIQYKDETGSTGGRGQLRYAGGNCLGTSCPVSIDLVTLFAEPDTFSVSDVEIFDAIVISIGSATGTSTTSSATRNRVTIPTGRMSLFPSAFIDGELKGFPHDNTSDLSGTIDFEARRFTAAGTFRADEDTVIRVSLRGHVNNFAPFVDAGALATIVECSQPFHGTVSLRGTAVDADGAVVATHWYHDKRVIGSELDMEFDAEVGTHRFSLLAKDNRGAVALDSITVVVQDTTPPVFLGVTTSNVCLAPPNHKYVVFDLGDDVTAVVADACDPDPEVVFTTGTSSQPDNGLGDGNSIDDVVVSPTSACLRSERAGTEPAGRRYTLGMSATDFSGNDAFDAATVLVGHDQSEHDCERELPHDFVATTDPRCHESASSRAGCRASGEAGAQGAVGALGVLLLISLRRANRRLSRRA